MTKNKTFIYLMYSLGYLGISILVQTTVKWYQYFYSPPELNQGGYDNLIPLGFVGLAMITARVIDGIADPLVAYFSDKSKSKLGRRRPYILYGSVPLTLTFILIWFPPVNGESMLNFIYLTVMLSLFFIFFTIVVGPYLALIGEITDTKKERINITTMQGITQILGVMIAEAGSGIIINHYDYKVMGIVLGLIALSTIILTPIFVRENPQNIHQKDINILSSIGMTLTNKNFVYYLVGYSTVWFGINTLTISMPYISEGLLNSTAESSGFMIAGAFVIALLFSPLIPKITMKLGKKLTFNIAAIIFAILLMLTGLFGVVFTNLAATIIILAAGIPLAILFVIPNAMVADIAEADGLVNGQKREGMFFGAQGLIIKLVIGFSSLITPFIFGTFGNSANDPLGLHIVGPISGFIIILGLVLFNKYALNEDMLVEIKLKNVSA